MPKPEVRCRVAIGIFADAAGVDAVRLRLHSQGIDRCVSFDIGSATTENQQGNGSPPLSSAMLGDLRARFPCAVVLRVELTGAAKDEALVARTLLESAAQSVQLHDL